MSVRPGPFEHDSQALRCGCSARFLRERGIDVRKLRQLLVLGLLLLGGCAGYIYPAGYPAYYPFGYYGYGVRPWTYGYPDYGYYGYPPGYGYGWGGYGWRGYGWRGHGWGWRR